MKNEKKLPFICFMQPGLKFDLKCRSLKLIKISFILFFSCLKVSKLLKKQTGLKFRAHELEVQNTVNAVKC